MVAAEQQGAVAQLGERLPCTQEVRSSILLGSTIFLPPGSVSESQHLMFRICRSAVVDGHMEERASGSLDVGFFGAAFRSTPKLLMRVPGKLPGNRGDCEQSPKQVASRVALLFNNSEICSRIVILRFISE